MEFKKRFEHYESKPTTAGCREKTDYIMKVDKNGSKYLVEAGHTNVYEIIQSHKEECNINRILDQAIKGDYSKLNFDVNERDLTSMPKTMQEFMNAGLMADYIWNTLPIETRKEYNHNKEEFLADWGSEKFLVAIGYKKPEQTLIEEATTDEQKQ